MTNRVVVLTPRQWLVTLGALGAMFTLLESRGQKDGELFREAGELAKQIAESPSYDDFVGELEDEIIGDEEEGDSEGLIEVNEREARVLAAALGIATRAALIEGVAEFADETGKLMGVTFPEVLAIVNKIAASQGQ